MVVQTCSSPRKGQQVTWLHLGKSCVCAPCMWWSNLCWFDSFGCFLVHTCTKRILAVNQFRNAHVIFPLAIWNGHQAFYLLWKASKPVANELGTLVCTVRYVQWLPLVCDAFGFVALCSVVAVRKTLQDKFDGTKPVHKPVPYVLSSVQNELKKCPSFVYYHHHVIFGRH